MNLGEALTLRLKQNQARAMVAKEARKTRIEARLYKMRKAGAVGSEARLRTIAITLEDRRK